MTSFTPSNNASPVLRALQGLRLCHLKRGDWLQVRAVTASIDAWLDRPANWKGDAK